MLETGSARLVMDATVNRLRFQSLEFSPDGSTLLTKSRDRTLRVWDTTTGIQLYKLSGTSEDELEVRIKNPDKGWWVPESMKLVWDIPGTVAERETSKQ